jgi:SNF2 family DNA or RNA helicase
MQTEELFYPEQQRVLEKIERARGGLVFWKVGTGKTRVGLEAFATLQKVYKWPNPCILLVVCKPKCFYDWREEVNKIGHDWVILENDYCPLPDEVLINMQAKPTLLLVSHGMIAKMAEHLDRNPNIRMVILDDGYLFKNPRSKKALAAHKLTMSRRAVLLSGSVMTQRDVTDIYGQAFAVNQHRRIAPNLTKFRSSYLHCNMDAGFPLYSPRKDAYVDIVKALGDGADFYFPPNAERKIHHQIITVPATDKQRKIFKDLKEWYEAKDYNLELENALQVALHIQRVSNGWILDDNGCLHYIDNNKVQRTIELVDEIVAGGERCVIWCAFTRDIDLLSIALPFATLQMSSRHKFDLDDWKNGEAKVCIATEASGVGVNHFEQTPYAIYFSMDWKWLDLQQSRGRTDRKSSKHLECFYYYMHTQGSLDRRIYDVASDSGNRELTLIKHGEVADWLKQK